VGKPAEDAEINLDRLQEGRHAFLDNGAVIFLDDAERVEISAENPRDNS
jgi:hypothetical protein